MSLIKSLPNYIMKYFNEMISNVETEDDRESKYKNDDSSFNINNNQNENQIVNLKINLNKNLNNERTKTYSKMNYIPIINKRIKKYPKNFYTLQQLMIKTKKYEKIHKEAFEEFQSKVNIKEDYLKKLNYESKGEIYRPLTLGIIEPSKSLFKLQKTNLKSNYLHESKIRDIIIAKILRCEYEPEDIKRIINGKKPWKSCKIVDI